VTGVDERRRLPIKQGDRIAYPVTFYDDDALYVLTGTTWRAEARHPTTGVLVATFTLTPNADQTANPGEAILGCTPAESANVRGGEWLDVEETGEGYTWLEFELDVSRDAAHA
jgi:hypothetical protein